MPYHSQIFARKPASRASGKARTIGASHHIQRQNFEFYIPVCVAHSDGGFFSPQNNFSQQNFYNWNDISAGSRNALHHTC